jgi:hypothetical protein
MQNIFDSKAPGSKATIKIGEESLQLSFEYRLSYILRNANLKTQGNQSNIKVLPNQIPNGCVLVYHTSHHSNPAKLQSAWYRLPP